MADISDLSITELKHSLKNRNLSARQVAEHFLSRTKAHAHLNSFIEVDEAGALAAADEADKKLTAKKDGLLLGIPVAVKDVILTKNLRTTAASKMLSNFIPPYDATVVQKLRQAGAVITGKTNMDEFAMGSSNENSAFGPVKNPWHHAYVPGGSSGGSAAAVAARLAPASLGTDTGGSIRQPASFCNIVGIKPTYGRVSRYGVMAFASSLDQVGPFANTVADCALITEAIAGFDRRDSTSINRSDTQFSASLGRDIRGLRIGVPKEYFIPGMEPEVDAAVKKAIHHLMSLGAEVVEISLPHTEAAVAVYYIIAPAEASSNLARYDGVRYGHRASGAKSLKELYAQSRSEGFGREVKRRIVIGTYVLSSGYYDAYYARAQKVRTLMIQDFQQAFSKQCDLIVCPTAPTGPFRLADETKQDPLQMYLNDVFTIPVNLAGLPGLSLPCGLDKNGLPLGLQLIGKPWDETTLFQVAHAYEQSTEWHKRTPQERK